MQSLAAVCHFLSYKTHHVPCFGNHLKRFVILPDISQVSSVIYHGRYSYESGKLIVFIVADVCF
jgi:hypothetical protein